MSDTLHLSGKVFTNSGECLPEAWIIDGELSWYPPSKRGPVRQLRGWFYPGLVDVHGHIGLVDTGAADRDVALCQARADYDAGVLLTRDAGVPGDTSYLDGKAHVPVIIRCARHIARPKRYLRHLAIELDNQADLPEVVAAQARRSDGWVKLVADWIDRAAGVEAQVQPLWDGSVLREAIAAAHENGARVTAHTFANATIDGLLDANIDCIEHGNGLRAEQIEEVARRQIPVTPTMMQSANFADFAAAGAQKFPAYAAQMRLLYERRSEVLHELVDAGVQLLAGSDAGSTIPHGSLPEELGLWAKAGLDAELIMASATWRARAYLASGPGAAGVKAAGSGLQVGLPAAFVHYQRDPAILLAAGELHPTTVYRSGQ